MTWVSLVNGVFTNTTPSLTYYGNMGWKLIEGVMSESITIQGQFFVARSNPSYPHVWNVYDSNEHYIESFGGSREAAQARVATLDLSFNPAKQAA